MVGIKIEREKINPDLRERRSNGIIREILGVPANKGRY